MIDNNNGLCCKVGIVSTNLRVSLSYIISQSNDRFNVWLIKRSLFSIAPLVPLLKGKQRFFCREGSKTLVSLCWTQVNVCWQEFFRTNLRFICLCRFFSCARIGTIDDFYEYQSLWMYILLEVTNFVNWHMSRSKHSRWYDMQSKG